MSQCRQGDPQHCWYKTCGVKNVTGSRLFFISRPVIAHQAHGTSRKGRVECVLAVGKHPHASGQECHCDGRRTVCVSWFLSRSPRVANQHHRPVTLVLEPVARSSGNLRLRRKDSLGHAGLTRTCNIDLTPALGRTLSQAKLPGHCFATTRQRFRDVAQRLGLKARAPTWAAAPHLDPPPAPPGDQRLE